MERLIILFATILFLAVELCFAADNSQVKIRLAPVEEDFPETFYYGLKIQLEFENISHSKVRIPVCAQFLISDQSGKKIIEYLVPNKMNPSARQAGEIELNAGKKVNVAIARIFKGNTNHDKDYSTYLDWNEKDVSSPLIYVQHINSGRYKLMAQLPLQSMSGDKCNFEGAQITQREVEFTLK